MNPKEVEKVTVTIGGLFPGQITVEQARFLRTELAPFTFEAAVRAVREHRATREFVNFPQLLEGCRAADRAAGAGQENGKNEGSWCDVRRRLHPWLGQAGDLEVIVRVHREWWHRSSRSVGYTNQIRSSCRAKLVEAGQTMELAEQLTETIFLTPDDFRMVLADLRGELAAVSSAH